MISLQIKTRLCLVPFLSSSVARLVERCAARGWDARLGDGDAQTGASNAIDLKKMLALNNH